MTAAFDHLKKLLQETGTLSLEAVESAEKEHGALTVDEKLWLESERHKLERKDDVSITLEQYLEASKVLDTAVEGSEEYNKALELVEKYEAGM